MLPVSREKYNAAVEDRDQALASVQELTAKLAALQGQFDAGQEVQTKQLTELEELRTTLEQANAGDLIAENERLTAELAELQAQVETLTAVNTQHESELAQRDERIAELEQTIERLNNRGAEPPAAATSETDAGGDGSPLNDFIIANADDTAACLERLRAEGF